MTVIPSSHLCRYFLAGFLVVSFSHVATAQKAPVQLECSVTSAQSQRTIGGDFDDKTQKVTLEVTMTNKSLSKATGPLKADFYVFGVAIRDRNVFKLLQKESFDFELEPRAKSSHATEQIVLKFDNTGYANFGDKYKGWIVQVKDENGEKVFEQKSSVFINDTQNLPNLEVGRYFDKNLKKAAGPGW